MSIVTIRATITKALAAWADSKGIPLARERQAFTKPPSNGTFIELYILPSNTIVASLDGQRKRYVGDVIINVWAKDGLGMGAAEKLAEEIAGIFTVVPKTLMPVSIETIPNVRKPITDGGGYIILPLTFSYRLESNGS